MDNTAQDEPPELVAIEIREYKNLQDEWLPWTDGVALFGVNGSGKTNVLECLALLMGSAETVALAALRLARPEPASLAAVIRSSPAELPWPPDVVPKEHLDHTHDELLELFPPLRRAFADAEWWRALGVSRGSDFVRGVTDALPAPVVALLAESCMRPVIRYDLAHIDYSGDTLPGKDPIVSRVFARTLMAASLPDDVAAMASGLPRVFAPLRSYLSSPDSLAGPWIPVLELPESGDLPATLQWLPHSRTADEVNDDLVRAFHLASEPAAKLTELLSGLPLAKPPEDGDWHWWLHEFGRDRGMEELQLTLPEAVSIVASGGGDADFALHVESGRDSVELAHTTDRDVLEHFSSGQRRWIDEALATVARELRRFGARAELYSSVYEKLPEDDVMAAVLAISEHADQLINLDGFWTGETLDLVLQALEPHLLNAALALLGDDSNVLAAAIVRHGYAALPPLQQSLVMRAFDEPEAHLHPSAQRHLASALDRMRLRGSNVVIASHSPHFLDIPQWSQLHVGDGDGPGRIREVPKDTSTSARSDLAQQLGINRGELLAGIDAILLVEGTHDQEILNALFRADLQAAKIAVVRMHGTDNLLATAQMDFLEQYLDVPITVMLDYTRIERVKAGKPQTGEETKLLELHRSLRKRKRAFDMVGLARPDIVCYLSGSSMRALHPDFPGWAPVIRRFTELNRRPPFKPWLKETYEVDVGNMGRIREVLAHMIDSGNSAEGGLVVTVNEITAHIHRGL